LRSAHDRGEKYTGIDVFEGKVVNMLDKDVLEPLIVKLHALKTATEAATMILRIDDIIAASKLEEEEKKKEKEEEEEKPGTEF
ncbi:MAG: thermosome subunit, partial [Thermoprotei archaeon]